MVRYEVNLKIDQEIKIDYLLWLKNHVSSMLKFNGFISAKIFQDTESNDRISVQYEIKSLNDFNLYVKEHSEVMRAEAIHKFGNKFSATRRILEEI